MKNKNKKVEIGPFYPFKQLKIFEGLICIYGIKTTEGLYYIGSTINLESRIKTHLEHLKLKKHHNVSLRSTFEENGKEGLSIRILELCNAKDLEQAELDWFVIFDSAGKCISARPRKRGKEAKPLIIDQSAINLFERNVGKQEKHMCFEWNGALSPNGYAVIESKGRKIKAGLVSLVAHDASNLEKYLSMNGPIILHECDNRKCTNPEHLRIASQKENVQDMLNKGRHAGKLNEEKVRAIRELIKDGEATKNVAEIFGVTSETIKRVVSKKKWSFVKEESELTSE